MENSIHSVPVETTSSCMSIVNATIWTYLHLSLIHIYVPVKGKKFIQHLRTPEGQLGKLAERCFHSTRDLRMFLHQPAARRLRDWTAKYLSCLTGQQICMKEMSKMKRINIKCPYCGSRAYLQPSSVVYGDRADDVEAKLLSLIHI